MLTTLKPPKYRPPKEVVLDYSEFRGGINTLFRQTELRNNELSQADNLYLIGAGGPTKRGGTQNYFLSGATGYGRGLISAKSNIEPIEALAITDSGYFNK